MLEKLKVHGFKALLDTEVSFEPLTILIGKNGAGKTSILDALQLIGNFARGGVSRCFGPPPWSLGWQRTRGFGTFSTVRFELEVSVLDSSYRYLLALFEKDGSTRIDEERLVRRDSQITVAKFEYQNPPASGTVLNPPDNGAETQEIRAVSALFQSIVCYELNPSSIEQGNDVDHDYISRIGRDGYGVAGFLAYLKDKEPDRFALLENRLRLLRPETLAIDVWSSGKLFWGLKDRGQDRAFPAVHLSWGDRQLVGLLCILYSASPGSCVAIEEIDRGFHHSRYSAVVELLSEVAYDGLDGAEPMQIVITTHSPSFLNRLSDRSNEIRLVTRAEAGGTIVRPLRDILLEKFGTEHPDQAIGEIWEMDLLEDAIQQTID